MYSHDSRPNRQIFRNAASLLALAGVLISSLGIVVLPATNRDSSQAFPCQGGHCGCSSAAQCWQSCCCTSVAERLAWAEANDVTPPSFLFELLAASEQRRIVNRSATCCSHRELQGGQSQSCSMDGDRKSPARVVLLSDLSRCRGLSRYMAIFGSAICEPLPDTLACDVAPVLWLQTFDESFESPLPSPPTPPPRVVV
jgi:hypothetical protein